MENQATGQAMLVLLSGFGGETFEGGTQTLGGWDTDTDTRAGNPLTFAVEEGSFPLYNSKVSLAPC